MKQVMGLAVLAVLAVLPLVVCGQTVPAGGDEPWVKEAREVAAAIPPKLLAVLSAQIQQSGPGEAIGVCRDQAPKMAQAASQQSGWQVRRVSLGNRNPKAVPDGWERETLAQFERSQASGADVATLERVEVVLENGQPVRRYMKALGTGALCLQCHGAPEQLGPGVPARLQQLYPEDRATGYSMGQVRGAITLRQVVN